MWVYGNGRAIHEIMWNHCGTPWWKFIAVHHGAIMVFSGGRPAQFIAVDRGGVPEGSGAVAMDRFLLLTNSITNGFCY